MTPRRELDDNAPLSDYELYLLRKLFKAGGEIPQEFWASVRSKMEIDGPRLIAADLSGIKGEDWRYVGAAGQPAFANAFTNFDAGSPGTHHRHVAFYKDVLGIVHLKGLITGGTANTLMFTLPAGYRPWAGSGLSSRAFPCAYYNGSNYHPGTVYIGVNTGEVKFDIGLAGATQGISFEGISFRAEDAGT